MCMACRNWCGVTSPRRRRSKSCSGGRSSSRCTCHYSTRDNNENKDTCMQGSKNHESREEAYAKHKLLSRCVHGFVILCKRIVVEPCHTTQRVSPQYSTCPRHHTMCALGTCAPRVSGGASVALANLRDVSFISDTFLYVNKVRPHICMHAVHESQMTYASGSLSMLRFPVNASSKSSTNRRHAITRGGGAAASVYVLARLRSILCTCIHT